MGRMNAKYGFDFTAVVQCLKFLYKKPRTECALLVTVEMCLLQLRLYVIVIPRYILEVTLLIKQLLMV